MAHYPSQAQYFVDKFNTDDFVLKTFTNNNVDNTWMLRQGDVVILVEEEYDSITLKLGGSSHAVYQTGKVTSDKITLPYSRPGRDVGEINEAKRQVLENEFNGTSDDLYEAFVEAFGSDQIKSDER